MTGGTIADPLLVVFDCDGVLVDSETVVIEVAVELLAAEGIEVSARHIADHYVGLSAADVRSGLEADFGLPVPADLLARVERESLARFPTRLKPVEGMTELQVALEGPRCVASSSSPTRIHRSLELTGLLPHFPDGSLFSAHQVERGKPAPDLFLLAARTMGIEAAHCVVVEDSPHGVAAGVAAGMVTIGLVAAGHTGPDLADRLRAAGAAAVIDRPEHLLDLIGQGSR